jgi:hypothetical protein
MTMTEVRSGPPFGAAAREPSEQPRGSGGDSGAEHLTTGEVHGVRGTRAAAKERAF